MNRVERTCTDIMTLLVKWGFSSQVHRTEVERAIVQLRGADQRTLTNWKRALETLGFLKATGHDGVFTVELLRVPLLLPEILKREDKQQKLI